MGTHGNPWEPMGTHGNPIKQPDFTNKTASQPPTCDSLCLTPGRQHGMPAIKPSWSEPLVYSNLAER